MWSNLIILHSESKDRDAFVFEDCFYWKTCMRTIYISDVRVFDSSALVPASGYDVYFGYEAYKLLLKVVSGIKSRLLGETEISSQFKEIFSNLNLPKNSLGEYLRNLRDQIIEDSRKIRSKYLVGLGDQSYGGMANKYLGNVKTVAIVGTGNLSHKMIPWLKENKRRVLLVGRNLEKLEMFQSKFGVEILSLENYIPQEEAIVIAAPVRVESFFADVKSEMKLIDFREDNFNESFSANIEYKSFSAMLGSLQEQEERNANLRSKLESVVNDLSEERENSSQNFFYGWEDIPCYAV
jgi:glutamyl-tRNA reductase